jgi:hypothetical protein
MRTRRAFAVTAALLAGGCQSACQSARQPAAPAVLTRADDATMDRLKTALAKAVGRPRIELGPGDPTQTSVLSVLPPRPGPLEDRSLAKSTIFRLEIAGKDCTAIREDTGARVPLADVECRAAVK